MTDAGRRPIALVTGASSGIGRATVLRLLAAGWTVFAGLRDPRVYDRLLEEDPALGRRLVPTVFEMTDREQIADAARLIDARLDGHGIDALVNNAGMAIVGPLELVPLEDFREAFEVNLFGHIAVTQALLPQLRRTKGRIVFVSSIARRLQPPYSAPYSASKAAYDAAGNVLRAELRQSGIQVALLEPGSVSTGIWEKSHTRAKQMLIPDDVSEIYRHVPQVLDRVVNAGRRHAISPDTVATAVERALNARRMRPYYVIGLDAHFVVWARRLLPQSVCDRILTRALGA